MWELYDRLIEETDDKVLVDHIHMGESWTIIHAGPYCGVAVTVNEQNLPIPPFDHFIGKSLRKVAALCKSWDFLEATIGTAAINAYHNHKDIAFNHDKMVVTQNGFTDYAAATKNKKVAVIGHFYNLETFLTNAAKVSILERKVWPGDYPDSACEYLLPEQDFVFITGSAFINKTLPRLLQLSANATSIILGPSTPMSPILFDYGANELSGILPEYLSSDMTLQIGTGEIRIPRKGQRVRLTK
ncbi:MAG: DUF364 domain-containing protein [Anaerovoracaceae bacterium]